MVEACQQAGVLFMTAYRKYFEPSTLFLKQLIQGGSLGRIDIIHTAFSELYVPGVRAYWWSVLFYPKAKFFLNFIIREGFRDGIAGLVFALMMSFHSFLVRGKLYLLWKKS
jgi:hypothetical protein